MQTEKELNIMDPVKSCSRRLFAVLFTGTLLLFCAVAAAGYLGLNMASESLLVTLANADPSLSETQDISGQIAMFNDFFVTIAVPVAAGIFFIFFILSWAIARGLTASVIKSIQQPVRKKQPSEKATSPEARKEKENQDKRLFVHLMTVLQREGRLMDFFSEDLTVYEDAQIGAAVRNIQENCKKVVDKYLAPQAVVSEAEGEQITIYKGFDPNTVRLTGNVTGDPPFAGVVRHRGWKAEKVDLPTLSGAQDPGVIAPAEVEIL